MTETSQEEKDLETFREEFGKRIARGHMVSKAAETIARAAHAGQTYGNDAYPVHLEAVVEIVLDYSTEIEDVAAAWLHDIVEDCGEEWLPVVALFGGGISPIVYACTGQGANRKERNAHIYSRLAQYPRACLVKAADRLANLRASGGPPKQRVHNPAGDSLQRRKLKMYLNEHEGFMQIVGPHIPGGLRDALNKAAE